jgi:hypothetical protein
MDMNAVTVEVILAVKDYTDALIDVLHEILVLMWPV